MIARALGFSHSLGPRDSKKSKFSHLEIYIVVLEELKVFNKSVHGGLFWEINKRTLYVY